MLLRWLNKNNISFFTLPCIISTHDYIIMFVMIINNKQGT